jgi:hypothetical protein
MQNLLKTNSSTTLIWTATAGLYYQPQYNPDLSPTNWINLGYTLTATNEIASATDELGPGTRRFYRVVLLP